MTKKIVILLGLFGFHLSTIAQDADSLTIELTRLANENALVGFGVAIVDQDGVLYANGFGYADQVNKTPYTTNTVQPIASISKTLLGVSIMKAQELGKLALDGDINTHLPFEMINPHFPQEKITIRHLASHTSGLKDTKYYRRSYVFKDKIPPLHKNQKFGIRKIVFKKYVKLYNRNQAMPLTDFLQKIYLPEGEWYSKKHFLKKAPGLEVNYSNNGAALAALVIEGATGMSYKNFVSTYILEPLKMEDSGWSLDDFSKEQKSTLYFAGQAMPEYQLITFADGGFITNMEDFTKYFITMIQGYAGKEQLMAATSYKEMMQAQFNSQKGIFWAVMEKFIGHSGGDPGVRTFAHFDKNTLRANILFINTSGGKNESEERDKIFSVMDRYGEKLDYTY